MRAVIAIAVIVLLAGCTDHKEAGEDAGSGSAIDDSGDGGDVRITSRDGRSVSVDARGGNRADWPTGFKAYPGATVTSDIAMGKSDGSAKLITFESKDTPEKIVAFYRSIALTGGYEVELDLEVDGRRMATGKRADGRVFSISARPDGETVEASLSVGPKR